MPPVPHTVDFIQAVYNNDLKKVRDIIENDDKWKKNSGVIMACLHHVITTNSVDMLKLFDEKFTLKFKNEQLPLSLAAAASLEVFVVLAKHTESLLQPFEVDSHPLVVAATAGNTMVVRWLLHWATGHTHMKHFSKVIENAAIQGAAQHGFEHIWDMFGLDDERRVLVVSTLVKHGHTDKVELIAKTENADFSYKNWAILDACVGHTDALTALMRHPSVSSKVMSLTDYLWAVDVIGKQNWGTRRNRAMTAFDARVESRARILMHSNKMSEKAARAHGERAVAKERNNHMKRFGLHSYEYDWGK